MLDVPLRHATTVTITLALHQTILEFLPHYLDHAERYPRSFIMRIVGFYIITRGARARVCVSERARV